jgi:alkanesulfonate monooxygenase SsuD/methylene tetrahydromethanopterin reductase-like flavin-dependent oxidoreductase (luciferase family)
MQDWEEGIVKLGFFLPHVGQAAGPDAIAQAVERAEELGYDSLWVTDRILYPVKGQSPYPGTPDGSLPEGFKNTFDPLNVLAIAAAHTSRIARGRAGGGILSCTR